MSTQHTPGPWTFRPLPEQEWRYAFWIDGPAPMGAPLADVRDIGPESSANAAMMAAAPETAPERDRLKASNAELVAALQSALHESDMGVTLATRAKMNAALAHAAQPAEGGVRG